MAENDFVSRSIPPIPQGAVLSSQVSGSRYFFRSLTRNARPGIIAAYGGFEHCDPDFVVSRTRFAFPTLELVVAGRGSVDFGVGPVPLRAGSLLYYDQTTRFELRADRSDPMTKYFISFTGRGTAARVRRAGLRAGAVTPLAMFAEVQRVLEDLIHEGRHHRPTAERICAALVELLLLKIEELSGVSGLNGQVAEETYLRCKSVIETRTADLATLTDITRAAGVEASQLCRLFRRYQSLSPYQYLLHRKMALAAERLLEPGVRVKEAAAAVGFSDPYHFSRCFKKVHRVAPKVFQRSLQPH